MNSINVSCTLYIPKFEFQFQGWKHAELKDSTIAFVEHYIPEVEPALAHLIAVLNRCSLRLIFYFAKRNEMKKKKKSQWARFAF